MKHFVIYTVLRFGLFLAVAAVLSTITVLIFGQSPAVWLASLICAALISSVLSLKLLAGPREAFAESVEARAGRAKARFEEMRSREDAD